MINPLQFTKDSSNAHFKLIYGYGSINSLRDQHEKINAFKKHFFLPDDD